MSEKVGCGVVCKGKEHNEECGPYEKPGEATLLEHWFFGRLMSVAHNSLHLPRNVTQA